MTKRWLSTWATTLACTLILVACGGGSGRGGSDVAVTGTGPSESVLAGATAVFVMTVANIGDNPASTVNLVNLVGNQLALTGITCSASGGAVCPETVGVTMTITSLPAGGSLAFAVSARVAAGANGAITNTLSASYSEDTSRTNNSATAAGVAYSLTGNLVVTGAGPTGTVPGGGSADFVMTVRNDGPDAASAVSIVDDVGNNLTVTAVQCNATGGAVCPATLGIRMNVDTLPVGGALTFTITTTVTAGTSGVISNTLTASAPNDTDRTDSFAVATGTAYTARAGVFVSGVGPATVIPAGNAATFTMTVSNAGPDVATDVRIVDTVSGNLTQTGGTCRASGGAVCPTPVGPVMTVPTLPVGGILTFDIATLVAAGTNGSITNTMTATPSNDPDRSDNSAVAVGTAAAYNLIVSGTAPTGPIPGGSAAVFTMLVSNAGPGLALAVPITDTVSANLTIGAITCVAGGGAVCPASLGMNMVAPSIPSSDTLTFTVTGTVTAGTVGAVSNTMTATGAGDSRPNDNTATATATAVSADLGVSQTAANGGAPVGAGGTAVFTAVVANPGPGAATNMTITETLTAGYIATVTCNSAGGAICPTPLGPVITVPSLPAASRLTFTYTVPVASTQRGNIVNQVQVSAIADTNTANNSASVTVVAVDPRNGAYKAFAADGREYDMAVDFDARAYTMAGNGQSVQRSFTADTNGDFTVSSTSRFRVAPDLLVGGHDFGGGVLPYVAGRNLGTSINELGGAYNLATRNVPASGAAVTRAGTARVSGNVLQVCLSDAALPPLPQNCGVADLKNYALAVIGDVYTGTEVITGEKFTFRLAHVGASTVLLSAGPAPDGTQRLVIGLPDAAGLVGGVVYGSSTAADWVTITLGTFSYAFTGVSGASDSTLLEQLNSGGPFAMLRGYRQSDLQQIFVMQASPLVVVFGKFGGGASGLLQVAVP